MWEVELMGSDEGLTDVERAEGMLNFSSDAIAGVKVLTVTAAGGSLGYSGRSWRIWELAE